MKRRILDIWAVQNNPEELYTALAQIKTDVTIFENVMCEFKIGANILRNRQFDKIIYSEGSDTLIILTRGGKATIKQAEEYLQKHNINYNEVVFTVDPTPYTEDQGKEHWFARDPYVLEDALNDSLNNNVTECEYDATIEASLTFKYYGKNDRKYTLLKIPFKGMIDLKDKYILITHSKYNKNITYDDILQILNKKGIVTGVTGLGANIEQ